ncbi:hypothetical protein EON63_22640 [archaeon]|nr:MAG: hypothetical protein EON63_22640 [archaeon]
MPSCWVLFLPSMSLIFYLGHSHYVMMVRINPRDSNTFCSASLDKTIKVGMLEYNMHYGIHYTPHTKSIHLQPNITIHHTPYTLHHLPHTMNHTNTITHISLL